MCSLARVPMNCCASTPHCIFHLLCRQPLPAWPHLHVGFSRMEELLQHPVDFCDLLGIVKTPSALEKGAMLAVTILTEPAAKGNE